VIFLPLHSTQTLHLWKCNTNVTTQALQELRGRGH
jgi:hypothetical protein